MSDATAIATTLGIQAHAITDSDSEAAQKIYEYVKGDKQDVSEQEILHTVRKLEQQLGPTALGERRLDRVYRYVKLNSLI